MYSLFRPLKTQITLAILMMTGLFAATALYSMHVIERQRGDKTLLQLAGQLRFHQQHFTVQAMQYQENAPRDYPSYYRDLKLYFQDLKRSRSELDAIIGGFASNDFTRLLGSQANQMMAPELPAGCMPAAIQLAETWEQFSAGLNERIGDDPEEPRLEWAAAWIAEQDAALERDATRLVESLESLVDRRARHAQALNRAMLLAAVILSIAIMVWFHRRVLRPMGSAMRGFDAVASGDFTHQVPVTHDDELGSMVVSFNLLSQRLAALHRLLTKLQQGNDLSSTLQSLSEALPELLPVDWIGILLISVDGRIQLQQAYSDGKTDPIGQQTYPVEGTLLAECIQTRQPLHIADVPAMARMSSNYRFLETLTQRGRSDAIFLPIGGNGDVAGVVVFASRFPNSYKSDHLALLKNIGVLVGASLTRSIQLSERSRLASIGQFASGISHEIRNPLATINLALDHVRKLESLPDSARRRVELAGDEVKRMERLLADILLYARPLTLERSPVDVAALLQELIGQLRADGTVIDAEFSTCPIATVDEDKIRQVLVNLLRNAQQASPPDSAIHVACGSSGDGQLWIRLQNDGEPIPERVLERIFEPFVSSKRGGTGLGMAIVRNIVDAHGGSIDIASGTETGTLVHVVLPTNTAVDDEGRATPPDDGA